MTSVKSCFFFGCPNTSQNCPRKIFLRVPKDEKIRMLWYQSARNTRIIPSTGNVFCCEDHFDLKSDCENWQFFKTIGTKLIVRKEVVPRNLGRTVGPNEESQLSKSAEKRKIATSQPFSKRLKIDPAAAKHPEEVHGPRRRLFDDDAKSSATTLISTLTASTSTSTSTSTLTTSTSTSTSTSKLSPTTGPPPTTPKKKTPQTVESPSGKFNVSSVGCLQLMRKTKSTQTYCKGKSVGVLAKVSCDNKETNTTVIKKTVMKAREKLGSDSDFSPIKSFSEQATSYCPSSDSGNSTFKFPGQGNGELGKIEKHTRLYTGLPPDVYFVVEKLCSQGLSKVDVLLTLKKIRTNDSFSRIAIDFGYSYSYPSKIFAKTVPLIANHLQVLITWPSAECIKKVLPQQFWANYKEVQSIIDCFEIKIQKPSGAVHQAVTWSQYKSCNTAKYLISSTPSGLVNFISAGYGGRTSDKEIIVESGYLDKLPEGCHVLADRGFKQVAHLIEGKSCKLLRPPSVLTGIKPSKEEVRRTKSIASLRIHIERVIRRLREFKMISPHACIPLKLLPLLDYIVIIACAIINLQGPIIANE